MPMGPCHCSADLDEGQGSLDECLLCGLELEYMLTLAQAWGRIHGAYILFSPPLFV